MSDYSLTPAQKKAFAELRSALAKCHRAGVYLFDWNGSICGINGRNVHEILTVADYKLADEQLCGCPDAIRSSSWHSGHADDALYIKRKHGGEA